MLAAQSLDNRLAGGQKIIEATDPVFGLPVGRGQRLIGQGSYQQKLTSALGASLILCNVNLMLRWIWVKFYLNHRNILNLLTHFLRCDSFFPRRDKTRAGMGVSDARKRSAP